MTSFKLQKKTIPLNHSLRPTGSMWQCLYLQRSFPLPVLCYYFAGFGRFLGVNIFEWRWLLWVLLPVHQIQTRSVGGSPTRSIGICWPWKEVQLVTRLQMHTTDRSLYAVNSICRDLHKTKLMISGWVIKSHCHPFSFGVTLSLYTNSKLPRQVNRTVT